VTSIYTGLSVAVVLLILSPTVWVDIVHKAEKADVENQLKAIEDPSKAKIAELEKQKVPGIEAARASEIDSMIAAEKKAIEPQLKEIKDKMPKAIFPLKNPAVYSMSAAFLIGILVSLIAPDKKAEEKYAAQKLREYVGIGSEE
jgi:Na+(H+)/acetate symporter ActP